MVAAVHTDAEILEACRAVAAKGLDPTYRQLRSHGIPACGIRLRAVRDAAVMAGTLVLPIGSRIKRRAVQDVLIRADRSEVTRRPAWVIPQTLREFMRIERRLFDLRKKKSDSQKTVEIQTKEVLSQPAFSLSDTRDRPWRALHHRAGWIRSLKANPKCGSQFLLEYMREATT